MYIDDCDDFIKIICNKIDSRRMSFHRKLQNIQIVYTIYICKFYLYQLTF